MFCTYKKWCSWVQSALQSALRLYVQLGSDELTHSCDRKIRSTRKGVQGTGRSSLEKYGLAGLRRRVGTCASCTLFRISGRWVERPEGTRTWTRRWRPPASSRSSEDWRLELLWCPAWRTTCQASPSSFGSCWRGRCIPSHLFWGQRPRSVGWGLRPILASLF